MSHFIVVTAEREPVEVRIVTPSGYNSTEEIQKDRPMVLPAHNLNSIKGKASTLKIFDAHGIQVYPRMQRA